MAPVKKRLPLLFFLGIVAMVRPSALKAQPALSQAQIAQVDRLRAAVAAQVQLHAFDLLDELIFSWIKDPVFATPTPLVLASLTVPAGLGSAMKTVLENHLAALLTSNPASNITLVHCPACTAILVHAGAQGTVISRGMDAPETLAKVSPSASDRHALFIDIEAEGTSLVLRARITALQPNLPIVYARSLSSAGSAGPMLRQPERLKSVAEARAELFEALQGHGRFSFPVRLMVQRFASSDTGGAISAAAVPYVWLLVGAELALTQARAWTASLSVGGTWIKDAHKGWLAEVRFARLISGRARSLTQPDLYLVLAASAVNLRGTDTVMFKKNPPDFAEILAAADPTKARAEFAAWRVGLEMRIKNRISAAAFLESVPALNKARAIDHFVDLDIAKFHTLCAEVGFWF